ncbi:MAG: hypothetical protein ABI741_06310 [Ferruginibacter sp.]
MNRSSSLIAQLSSIRNRYGTDFSSKKLKLLTAISNEPVKGQKVLQPWYDTLLFLLAYPDNRPVYQHASRSLLKLQQYIQSNEHIQRGLYNSGITNTRLCAAFSFEIVKWMRKKHPGDIRFSSFDTDDGHIQSILSVVMPKVESEIMQDANANWRSWLKESLQKGEDMLDQFIAIFDQGAIRPEVKDELWNALGLNVEIDFPAHDRLPASLTAAHYYHRSLIKKDLTRQEDVRPIRINLDEAGAEQIIDCSRMILIRHLREIDPVTFTGVRLVSYYHLQRGLSIALMGMVPDRRHPIDSYMGYVVFKNGLPVAYAGSWILFDSGRIGLNIFPSYRGGESQYIFDQVLKLHRKVYHLKRFSVDPYQVGKENSDGIRSGAFWVYYHVGFRPIGKEQKQLAETEAQKIKTIPGYRSPATVLKILAGSRMELILQKAAVRFDATDLSRAYAAILIDKYNNNRKTAQERCLKKLVKLLAIKNYQGEQLQFILENWSVLLLSNETVSSRVSGLKSLLKKLFALKAVGSEEAYIAELQKSAELRKFLESVLSLLAKPIPLKETSSK